MPQVEGLINFLIFWLKLLIFQRECWAGTIAEQSILAVGGGGAGQGVNTRKKVHLEKQLNLPKLAKTYNTLERIEYIRRINGILKDDT